MRFVVDTVSEFTYFQNMLLGLADALQKCVGVNRTYLKKFRPLTASEINDWEETHRIILPADMKSFYSSSNGYLFEWTYNSPGSSKQQDTEVIGKIKINPLEDVKQIYGYETTNDSGVAFNNGRYVLRLALESKVYELADLPQRGKVVLIYLYPDYMPSIWLLTTSINFYYLANDISSYLRMAIAHLGIPNWQMAYTSEGAPQWTENMFTMLLPQFLPLNKSLEKMRHEKLSRKYEFKSDVPLNKLNCEIFLGHNKKMVTAVPNNSESNQSSVTKNQTPQKQTHTVRIRTPINNKKPLHAIKKW